MGVKRSRGEDVWDDEMKRVAADSAYGQRLREIQAATDSIGSTPRQHLIWVTGFVREDPQRWHPGERSSHGDRLLALSRPVPRFVHGGISLPPSIAADDVDAIHRELKMLLHVAVTADAGARSQWMSMSGLEACLIRATPVGQKPAVWGVAYRSESPGPAVLHAVKDLVIQAGGQLIACRLCQAPLVAFKKQQFCNEACSQKFRNDKKALKALATENGEDHGKSKTRPR